MTTFTIRDIENLTGIKAHTLRIWEQRYEFFRPKRKQSLHRIYDNEDLKQLLRISFLYHNGMKISRIAALSESQVLETVSSTKVAEGSNAVMAGRLLEAALDFNEEKFLSILDEITERVGLEKCITEVCYPYLKKVGLLWSTNNMIPSQEHFSSYLIQHKIIAATDQLKTAGMPVVIMACPEGEFHELPLLFINYLLKKSGCNTLFLGANTGEGTLEKASVVPGIKAIYFHLLTNFTGHSADEYFGKIALKFADKKIFVSGEGTRQMETTVPNLILLKKDEEVEAFTRCPNF